MLVKMLWQILFLCTFQVFVAENAALQVSSKIDVKCLCGERPKYEVKFFPVQDFNAGAENSHEFLSSVCASHSCFHNPTDPLEKRSFNPVKFGFSPLDEEAEDSSSKVRTRRFPKSCNDSISPIKNAVMDCHVWPEFMTCEINCTHGYAMMEDGRSMLKTTRKCRENESTWQPKASFPVCEPYINCQVILVKPGDLNCKTSGPMISYCDISCEPDEDKDSVPNKRYECLDENFAKSLPHCAAVAKDVNLIPRPQTSQGLQKGSLGSQMAPQDPQKAPQRA